MRLLEYLFFATPLAVGIYSMYMIWKDDLKNK